MKTLLLPVVAGTLMFGVALAQDTPSQPPSSQPDNSAATPAQTQQQQPAPQPSTPQASTPQSQPSPSAANASPAKPATGIAPGSVIPVTLTKTVDAKKVKTGDEVVAKVTQDMKTNAGDVILAKDTRVIGHVTEAQARNKGQKESQVGISFDRAVSKDGSEMQTPMSIQAVIGPVNNQSASGGSNEAAPASLGTGAYPNSPRSGAGTPSAQTPAASGAGIPDADAANTARPPITAQTEGVVGISDLKLTTVVGGANLGSLLTSDKNNVKLESGTVMLLRVNQ